MDQPSLKETATDCGLLVPSNWLPKARLGHQLSSRMDPEGEDGRPTNTRQTLCSDEFHVVFLHYLHYFFPKEVKNKFNKGGKDLKLENYRKLKEKIEEDTN